MSEPQAPQDSSPTEQPREPNPKVLDNSGKFARRIRKGLRNYPGAQSLLNEGRFSDDEMQEPHAEIGAMHWNYTFIRMKPEFLDFQSERTPRDPRSSISRDVIHIVYGDAPSYTRVIMRKDKVQPEIYTSDDPGQEPIARRKVSEFIRDIEREF